MPESLNETGATNAHTTLAVGGDAHLAGRHGAAATGGRIAFARDREPLESQLDIRDGKRKTRRAVGHLTRNVARQVGVGDD